MRWTKETFCCFDGKAAEEQESRAVTGEEERMHSHGRVHGAYKTAETSIFNGAGKDDRKGGHDRRRGRRVHVRKPTERREEWRGAGREPRGT